MTITTTRRGWRRARRRAQPATGTELDTAGDTDEPTEDTDATSEKPDEISTAMTEASLITTGFASLGIDPRLDAALALAELVEPTPIQAGAIPAGAPSGTLETKEKLLIVCGLSSSRTSKSSACKSVTGLPSLVTETSTWTRLVVIRTTSS